jgi:hypothetical protein
VGVIVGYARCSTDKQDLTAQREQLASLGAATERIYLDDGLTGTNRARGGLDQALAAVRSGDTFTVTKLDRLARSVPDALFTGVAVHQTIRRPRVCREPSLHRPALEAGSADASRNLYTEAQHHDRVWPDIEPAPSL